MALQRTNCSECGERKTVCPKCGGSHVTPMDNPQMDKPNTVVAYGEDGTYIYTNVCWDCGYSETVTVTVERTQESG